MSPLNSKADLNKLSSLAGRVVYALDGSEYRVRSVIATPKGSVLKLANLSGEPVPTPADFRPVGLAMARFATWLRYHLAYNKDFDLYINSYIEKYNSEHPNEQLPYPVGPDGQPFRWSDWFQRTISPKIYVKGDPAQVQEMKDEAIHDMLVTTLGKRDVIGKFSEKIKNFNKNKKVQKMNVAQQLTVYLTTVFSHQHRLIEMQEFLNKQQPEEEMSMWQPSQDEESGGEQNILETEEHGVGTENFQSAEAERDIQKFKSGFSTWLKTKFTEKAARNFVVLFDAYWDLISSSGEDRAVDDVEKSKKQQKKDERKGWLNISRGDLAEQWHAQTGLSEGALKDYFGRLPGLIEEYILSNQNVLGKSSVFTQLMNQIRKEQGRARPAKASVTASGDIQEQMNAEYALHGKSDKWFKLRSQQDTKEPEKAEEKQAAGVESDFSEALRNSENPDVVDKDIHQPTESVPEAAGVKTAGEETYEVFVRDFWRIEKGRRVPNPGADEEQLATGLDYDEARDMCELYNSTHDPGEVSRKAEFRGEGNATDDDEEPSAYTIYGTYQGNTEEIDTAEDQQSAEYLVGEYKLAFGKGWDIWAEDAQGNRTDMPAAPGKRDLDVMQSMGIRGSKKARLIAGPDLTPEMRKQVESSFPYRWTHENPKRSEIYHCDKCNVGNNPHIKEGEAEEGHQHPTVPLISDDQWIREHAFDFTNDGRLKPRKHAEPVYLAQHSATRVASVAQKFAMEKAAYNPGIEAFTADGAIYCAHCAQHVPNAEGPVPDGGGEADSPQHCDKCGRFLENPLTTDGYRYLNEMIREAEAEGQGESEIIQLWDDFYPERLDNEYAPDSEVSDMLEMAEPGVIQEADQTFLRDMGIQGSKSARGLMPGGRSKCKECGESPCTCDDDKTAGKTALQVPQAKDDPRGAGDNWREEYYESKESGPSAKALFGAAAPAEVWQCLDCGHEGMIATSGGCEACGSQAVSPMVPDAPEGGEHLLHERINPDAVRPDVVEAADKTAQGAGNTTVTMQEQNATFPGQPGNTEPMAVPEAQDQAPGPHSPNAPGTAPRTPGIMPRIVDVPAGTVGDDATMEAQASLKQAAVDRPMQCTACGGSHTEIEPNQHGGYDVWCDDCEDFTYGEDADGTEEYKKVATETGNYACCGSFGKHKDNCSVKGTDSTSKHTADAYDEPVDMTDEHAVNKAMSKPPLAGLQLYADKGTGKVHIALDSESEQTFCGKTIGYSQLQGMHDNTMIPTNVEEVEEREQTNPAIWCTWCLDEYNGDEEQHIGAAESVQECCGAFKPKHKPDCEAHNKTWDNTLSLLNKKGMIPHEFNNADGQAIRNETMPDTGREPHVYDDAELHRTSIGSVEDDELMEQAEETLRKQGAPAATTPAVNPSTNPNVQQQQQLAISHPLQVPGQPGSSVAIMPNQGEDEGGIRRHTVEPELPNANYHMQGSDDDPEMALIASEMMKLGGGSDFYTQGTGKTPQEAFSSAVDQARYESGHGGYSGTIAEKSGYVLTVPPKPYKPDQWIEMVRRVRFEDEVQGDSISMNKKVEVKPGGKCPKCGKGKIELVPSTYQPQSTGNMTRDAERQKQMEQWAADNPKPKCNACGAQSWDLYSESRGSGKDTKYYTFKKTKVKVTPEVMKQLKRDGEVFDDKWGPALAVQLAKNKWLFCGIASS